MRNQRPKWKLVFRLIRASSHRRIGADSRFALPLTLGPTQFDKRKAAEIRFGKTRASSARNVAPPMARRARHSSRGRRVGRPAARRHDPAAPSPAANHTGRGPVAHARPQQARRAPGRVARQVLRNSGRQGQPAGRWAGRLRARQAGHAGQTRAPEAEAAARAADGNEPKWRAGLARRNACDGRQLAPNSGPKAIRAATWTTMGARYSAPGVVWGRARTGTRDMFINKTK